MDFLDPRLRRSYNRRLVIGYILITIVIGLASIILVYGAYGYGINTKTGQITQNGLLFVDSQPAGAQVILNNQYSVSTTARLVLAAGDYNLVVRKTGYIDWQRKVTLDEHSVARFNYPLLFPVKPVTSVVKSYSSLPGMISQSPDGRWLVTESPDGSFDVYDTNALDKPPQSSSLPTALLGDQGASQQYSAVEWTDDNNHLLLKHSYAGGSEFIIFDRSKPEQSINITKLFNISADQVYLRNKKFGQIYIYDQTAATVRAGDISKPGTTQLLLDHVLAFSPYGANLASYVTNTNAPTGEVAVRLFDNGKTFPLAFLNTANNYFLKAGQFNGHWYYVVGADSQPHINIYKDPLNSLEARPSAKAQPQTAINLNGAEIVSFSVANRFIAAEKGNNFVVYDLGVQKNYSYSLSTSLAGPLRWLDEAHLIGQANGQLMVIDYDSLNSVTPAASAEAGGGYISRDLHHLLSIAADQSGGYQLVNIDMRAGTDLPKQP